MVAITVILAAVIGTFVLGLGDSLGDSQPTAQLDASIDYSNNNITVEHGGGDPIAAGEMTMIVNYNGSSYQSNGAYSERLTVGDQFVGEVGSPGTTVTANADEEVRIRIIHESSGSVLLDRTIDTTGSVNIGDSFPLSAA
ncbi:type IV pilin [Halorubrum depositum]